MCDEHIVSAEIWNRLTNNAIYLRSQKDWVVLRSQFESMLCDNMSVGISTGIYLDFQQPFLFSSERVLNKKQIERSRFEISISDFNLRIGLTMNRRHPKCNDYRYIYISANKVESNLYIKETINVI